MISVSYTHLSPVKIGGQGVYRMDAGRDGFGAFTTNCPAASMSVMGVNTVIIGHCEERADKLGIMKAAGAEDTAVSYTHLDVYKRQGLISPV